MPSGLWELLKDNDRPLTYSQKKRYMIMLLEGVAYMHKENIMHRVRIYIINHYLNITLTLTHVIILLMIYQ